MKTKQTIVMSVALATLLAVGTTGCGGSDDSSPAVASTAVDITVERGKVYDANVTDSSAPAKVATQQNGQNIYTFTTAPTFPVLVNGGWIDVNNDGVMDVNDTLLDIPMQSYSTSVTTVTTFIADANETIRNQNLENLAARLNASGIGEDANITVEDLLQVPSLAPRDVFVAANAIYKDMKENADTLPDENAVLSQFTTLYTPTVTSTSIEITVMEDLVISGNVANVSDQDLFEFVQEQPDAVVPELAQALLKNNITSIDPYFNLTFNDDYTVVQSDDIHEFIFGWRVDGNKLIIDMFDGDRTEYTFDSATPANHSNVSVVGFYGDTIGEPVIMTVVVTEPVVVPDPVIVTEPVVVTPPTTTLPDLNGYSSIIIYKNIAQTTADSLLSAFASNAGFDSSTATATTSCEDYGFTNPTITDVGGLSSKVYTEVNTTTYTVRSCSEFDYANVTYANGSSNIIAYYGN